MLLLFFFLNENLATKTNKQVGVAARVATFALAKLYASCVSMTPEKCAKAKYGN